MSRRVREPLAGARVLVTGVTGFLGQALLERLLASVPGCRPVLLVRPRGSSSGRQRVERLLRKPVFARLREQLGDDGLAELLEDRIEVLEGDISEDLPALPDDLDVVVHCAGTVSFDPPIDTGFRVNLLGVQRLVDAIRASGARPHLVHVSTAYVAGLTKGIVPEAPLEHTIDWRAELAAALRAREEVEHASREPDFLQELVDRAAREHSRAGPMTVSEAAENRRRQWVDEQLVERGRARARSLGWPDVYTFTKALGERCVEDLATDLPVSIVRPSIIESALSHPEPGWIEGFKMAEPIILGFGRGDIPDFPGIPDGIVDIIPVDIVVNALVAIAANPPTDGPAHYHVSSGARNPLAFRELYELVRAYFTEQPLADGDRGEVAVPTWRFRGSDKVRRLLGNAERLVDVADKVVTHLPRSDKVRDAARRVDRQRRRLEFVRRYADIYGAYTEVEVTYTDDRTLALLRALDDDEREAFDFDANRIDWPTYIQDIHCPSVTAGLRHRGARRSRTSGSSGGNDGEVDLPLRQDVLAAFDLDGTIISANVIESYLWLRMADAEGRSWLTEAARLTRDLPGYLAAERRARESFLRAFYRRYEGASIEELHRLVQDQVAPVLLQRAAPEALRRVRAHRAAGHRTVLITGALDVLTAPFAPLFDEVVAAELAVDGDGRCSGFLRHPPLVGEARAAWLRRYAQRAGLDLSASYAYADSHSDLPLLQAVGHPVAVRPDVALFRHARKHRWAIEEWRHNDGTPRVLVPESRP